MLEENTDIDYKALYEQVIGENEGLRERLTQAALKDRPISDAIDGIVLVVQRSDPMKLYIWACIGFMIAMAIARLLEVILK